MPSTSTYIPSKVYKQQLLFDAFQSITGVTAVWPMMRAGNLVASVSGGFSRYLSETLGTGAIAYGRHTSGGPYMAKSGTSYLYAADAAWNSPTGELSFAGYVKFDAVADSVNVSGIVAKWDSATNNRAFNLQRTAAGTLGFSVTPDGTSAAAKGVLTSATIGTSWTFVAARYTPSTEMKVWVNTSVGAGSTTIPAAIYDSTTALQIGIFSGSVGPLVGQIGVFGMYAAALPDATITSLYNATKEFYGL